MSEARVLVVDDEPAIRALVAKIVERAGFPVDTAHDGSEAIARLESATYAVMVIDLMMPRVDGFGVIEHLRLSNLPRPAIIVISAGDSAALRKLDGSIVHSIIRKPFDVDVLSDLVAAAAREMVAAAEPSADILPFRREESE